MFEVKRPEYITFSEQTSALASLLSNGDDDAWRKYRAKTRVPLAPTGQPEGKMIGFFEQGLLTGAVILGVTTITSAALLGFYAVPAVVRRLR